MNILRSPERNYDRYDITRMFRYQVGYGFESCNLEDMLLLSISIVDSGVQPLRNT